jgi:hypothetical protein
MDEKPKQIKIVIFKKEKNYYEFSKVDTHKHLKLTYKGPYFESWHANSY